MTTFRKVMSIVFAIVALLWGNILLRAFLYEISWINIGTVGITIDAGISAFLLSLRKNGLVIVCLLAWTVSAIVFAVLNIIKAFRRTQSKTLNVAVVVSFVIMVINAIVTPPQTYAVSTYTVFRFLIVHGATWVFRSFNTASIVVTILTGFSLLPLKRTNQGETS